MSAWFKKFFDQDLETKAGDSEAGFQMTEETEDAPEEASEDGGQLALDVYQDKDNIIVKSTIAGVKPEDLDISISSNAVTVRGERKFEEEIKDEDYYLQECYWGKFSRSTNLPVEIDVERAEADLQDGILTLILPKAARSKTKKVRVKGQA